MNSAVKSLTKVVPRRWIWKSPCQLDSLHEPRFGLKGWTWWDVSDEHCEGGGLWDLIWYWIALASYILSCVDIPFCLWGHSQHDVRSKEHNWISRLKTNKASALLQTSLSTFCLLTWTQSGAAGQRGNVSQHFSNRKWRANPLIRLSVLQRLNRRPMFIFYSTLIVLRD